MTEQPRTFAELEAKCKEEAHSIVLGAVIEADDSIRQNIADQKTLIAQIKRKGPKADLTY